MENKVDNAIVQADAAENTAPNAEIKKKRGRKPKSVSETQEVNAPDTAEGVKDESVIDNDATEARAESNLEAEASSSAEVAEESEIDTNGSILTEAMDEGDCGGENTLTEAARTDNKDEGLAKTTTAKDAGHTVDVAEAMRKIMSFTAEMNKQTDESKKQSDDVDKISASYLSADTSLPKTEEKAISDLPADTSLPKTDKDESAAEEDQKEIGDMPSDLPVNDNATAEADTSEDADSTVLAEGEAHSASETSGLEGDNDYILNTADEINSLADGNPADADEAEDDYDNDDDGYTLEDEFDSIPDSFFGDSDNSSISALLYNDDDDSATADFEKIGNISFSELKEQMQRIKDEAIELRADETDDAPAEDETSENTEELPAEQIEDAEPVDDTTDEAEDDAPESPVEDEPAPEKKSYIRDIDRTEKTEEKSDEAEASTNEHIITIDRSRVKENGVPEGRFIDIIFDAVELFTFALLIIMMLLSFVFRHTTVSGPSMMPTFNDGDRLITSNLFYEPKRGDVVVFDDRSNQAYEDGPIIKRIIGLEGDVVKIEGGIIMVKENGSDEFKIVNYVENMEIPYRDMEEVTVGKGEMFVMGDNVNNSLDSTDRDENDPTRNVGNIKTDSILGKVLLRFYTVEMVFSEETQEWVTKGRIVFDTKFTLK